MYHSDGKQEVWVQLFQAPLPQFWYVLRSGMVCHLYYPPLSYNYVRTGSTYWKWINEFLALFRGF